MLFGRFVCCRLLCFASLSGRLLLLLLLLAAVVRKKWGTGPMDVTSLRAMV